MPGPGVWAGGLFGRHRGHLAVQRPHRDTQAPGPQLRRAGGPLFVFSFEISSTSRPHCSAQAPWLGKHSPNGLALFLPSLFSPLHFIPSCLATPHARHPVAAQTSTACSPEAQHLSDVFCQCRGTEPAARHPGQRGGVGHPHGRLLQRPLPAAQRPRHGARACYALAPFPRSLLPAALPQLCVRRCRIAPYSFRHLGPPCVISAATLHCELSVSL